MSALSPTQQSFDTQRQWLISVGFKHNVSADFKAWIMYNQPDIYNPTNKLAIPAASLRQLKELHSYNALKGTPEAPWYQFLKKLEQNMVSPESVKQQDVIELQNAIELQHGSQQQDEDWESKYNKLKISYDSLKTYHDKEKIIRKKLSEFITTLRGYMKITRTEYNDKIEHLKTQQLTQIKNLKTEFKQKLSDETSKMDKIYKDKIAVYRREHYHSIAQYDAYVSQCFRQMNECEKQIKLLTVENNSYKEGFSDISSSTLSQETLTKLQQHYETLSFPQYSSIICPITQEIMVEPVIAFDGQTYEKSAIEQWFKDNNKSPSTGTTLSSRLLIANHTIRKLIAEIVQS